MFVCKASSILKELKKYEPEILENCEDCLEKSIGS